MGTERFLDVLGRMGEKNISSLNRKMFGFFYLTYLMLFTEQLLPLMCIRAIPILWVCSTNRVIVSSFI